MNNNMIGILKKRFNRKTNTLRFNDFRQVFIVLEQGLEGFCNQYLATKTMNSVRTIKRL